MFENGARTREAVDLYVDSYLRTIYLQLRVLLLFNRTYFLVHDRISASTFDVLAKHLSVDLSEAWLFYDDKQGRRPVPAAQDLESFPGIPHARIIYDRLSEQISDDSLRPRSLWDCRLLMYQLRKELVAGNQTT
jgi:hypothetical protein